MRSTGSSHRFIAWKSLVFGMFGLLGPTLLGACKSGLPPAGSAECVEKGMIDVWKAVDGSFQTSDRGRILGCEHGASVSAAQLTASDAYRRQGWTAKNGYEEFVIQHVSEGPTGTPRKVSALLYLPMGGTPPYPVVAVNHGTNGIGPNCGPSHERIVTDYMAQPLVGHGYAVVAADYPGMGVDEGVYSYGVGDAEGRAILDGVRALYNFKDPRFDAKTMLTDELFLYGHSQGGQATLFAQKLYDAAVGPRLLGAISVAPGLADLRGFDQIIGAPARPIDQVALFMIMLLYSHMTYFGSPDASTWLTPSAQSALPNYLRDQCFQSLSLTVPGTWGQNQYLFTPSFISGAAGCPFSGATCPNFQPWSGYLYDSLAGNFRSSAPALILQGNTDDVVPPSTTACLVDRMRGQGNTVRACGFASDTHYTIVENSMNAALTWMAARRQGQEPDVCPAAIGATCR
jgi:pimeloyl-ACP methyl ester carboxylesterase